MTDGAEPNQHRHAPAPTGGVRSSAAHAEALDAFQAAFAGYLARNISLDQLRRIVDGCVAETRNLARVFVRSFTAAAEAECLPIADYRVLLADLAKWPDAGIHTSFPSASADRARLLADRYELQDCIAAGGIGVLYRALDLHRYAAGAADSVVAIKMLSRDLRDCPDALRSLQREARAVGRLSHPNIRAVHGFDRCASDVFIAMEWLDGESLAIRLDRTGSRSMAWRPAYRMLAAVGAGLTHAHGRGIVHGDVKPGNVFVTAAGQIKLLDFGQARALDSVRRSASRLAVSPAYASCELHEGSRPEIRDDVFALAVMAYRILAGARPFGRYSPLKAERAGIKALRPAGIDTAQWQMLQRGLAWRRDQRPATVREFLEGLLLMPSGHRRSRKAALHVAA